jgi:hypothetical protein
MLCEYHAKQHLAALRKQVDTKPEMQAWVRDAHASLQRPVMTSEVTDMRNQLVGAANRVAEGSFVYFMERDGYVKIGMSKNVQQRLDQVSRGSAMMPGMTVGPVRLLAKIPGGREQEYALHRRFAALHVHGEWFRPGEALTGYIASL